MFFSVRAMPEFHEFHPIGGVDGMGAGGDDV
jgi:hypothetical protein